jgi:hypothetical protein
MQIARLWFNALTVSIALASQGASATGQSNTIIALATILSAAEEATAVMNHCREVDPANKDLYDGLVLRLLTIYAPFYNQIDKILPAEGIRAGRGEKFYFAMLPSIRELAQTEVKDLATTMKPAQDIASCRSQRDDLQGGKGLFAPPNTRFPAAARTVDQWR